MRIRTLVLSLLILASTMTSTVARADGDAQRAFDIPAQPLAQALKQFADQTGLQLAFETAITTGRTSPEVKGDLSTSEALKQLLKGTGLRYDFLDERTVAVSSATEKSISKAAPISGSTTSFSASEENLPSSTGRMRLAQNEQDGAQKPAANSAKAAADASKIEEIVVTAQKREERLIDVPISLSVISGQHLDNSTDRGVADEINRVPGVISAFTNGNGRIAGTSSIVIVRGVAPTIGQSTTGYYLDMIPFGFATGSWAPDAAAYDMERVEVLRGPQGTLYGVNALNGVVRVLTRDADLNKFEFKARASTSGTEDGGENYRGDVAVNVPLIEGKLAARAVVGYQDWSGWIDKPSRKDANDMTVGNYRLKVNAKPTDRLSIGLLTWVSRMDSGQTTTSANGLTSLSLLDESAATDFDAYGLTVGYDFPGFALTSKTGYVEYKIHSFMDYAPFNILNTLLESRFASRVASEEVLLHSTAEGSWRWSAGSVYRDDKDSLYQYRRQNFAPADSDAISKSFAVFGELTRLFLDGRFELTAGARYFEDEIKNVERSTNIAGGVPAGGLLTLRSKFTKTTPRLVLTWHPSDRATLYASYGEGFRSGGNQSFFIIRSAPQFPPFEPDDLKNYELGLKGTSWGGKLGFEAAAFYEDWNGVQQSLQVPYNGSFTGATVNAEAVSGVGFEFATTVQPVDGLTFGVNFSWNDLEVDKDIFTSGLLFYPKGSRLAYSPEYTASVSVDYKFPLSISGYQGQFSASANKLPEMIAGRLSPSGTTPFRVVEVDASLMARASFGITSPRGWAASVYADNLTNETAISHDAFSPQWDTYARPRTIGLQLDYRY